MVFINKGIRDGFSIFTLISLTLISLLAVILLTGRGIMHLGELFSPSDIHGIEEYTLYYLLVFFILVVPVANLVFFGQGLLKKIKK
jgi:hypothetical protein